MSVTKKPKIEFEEVFEKVGEQLRTLFSALEVSQKTFISYCKFNGSLVFNEKERLADGEESTSEAYQIESMLGSVLALEYKDDITAFEKPGSTYTHHAVIVLPREARELIAGINELKAQIRKLISTTVDSRVKVDGEWQPVNKLLFKRIGRARANSNQIRRQLNMHEDRYSRITLSGTWQRPVYRKTYEEVKSILQQLRYDSFEQDIDTLRAHRHHEHFAYFYDNYYTSVDATFKYTDEFAPKDADGKKKPRPYLVQKVSSPIYILSDKSKDEIDIEVRFKMKQVSGGNDKSLNPNKKAKSSIIASEPIIKNPPIYTYLNRGQS